MTFENLSDIEWGKSEWKNRRNPVYKKLKVFFFLHELLMNSKFLLLILFAIGLQQPWILLWTKKILWQIQYITQNFLSWIIPL